MQMPAELASDFLATARFGGSSLLLVQANGGNNSVKSKSDDLLWIKASGARLDELTEKQGTVVLRCSTLRQIVRREGAQPNLSDLARRKIHEDTVRLNQAAMVDPGQARPSLETGFHALLGDVVLHLHPVYLNAFTCMEGGHELLKEIAPQPFAWVKYAAPGQELAVQVDQALKAADAPACVVLENHGFVASGKSAEQVIIATEDFLRAGRVFFGDFLPALIRPQLAPQAAEEAVTSLAALYFERWGEKPAARSARFGIFNQLEQHRKCFDLAGPLVPDDVVYAGGKIHFCSLEGIGNLIGSLPDPIPDKLAVAVEGAGTILLAANERLATAMEEMLFAHVLVRVLIARRGAVRTLPVREIEYLQAMESEKYRAMASAQGAC